MISSMQCKIMIHNHQQIVGICQSVKCKMPHRLVCFKCIESHLKDGLCQIQDIKDEQDLCAIIKDQISNIDTRYENSIIYCQIQKNIKIQQLKNYIEQWQDGFKKFDYLENIIKQIRQDLSSIKLEAYLQDNNSQHTLDQYVNNSIAQFTKLEKYMKGHPNFMIDLESKLQQSEQLDSIQDQLNKLNDKVQQDLQMNEEEILLFIKNNQEYQMNNEEILQYQIETTQYLSNEDFIKNDAKKFYQLNLDQFQINIIQGQGKINTGLLDELLEFYHHIIKKLPKNLQVLENLAKLYVYKKQYSNAVQQYNKCIQINPFEYRFYHNQAQILYNYLNNVNDALKCYDKFCEIDDTNYNAHVEKAQIYQKQSNHVRALECFSAYIKIDPNYHKKQQFLKAYQDGCDQSMKYDKTNNKINYITYIKKSQSHILQHDYKIALQLFNEYMKLDKNYFQKADLVNAILECCNQSYMIKSKVLLIQNQFLTALQCYDLYMSTHPNHNDALQNDYELIILECCDIFIIDDKLNSLPYIKKAQILQKRNEFQAAIQCYDQYINLDVNQNIDFLEALLKCCDQYINSEQQNHLLYIKKAQILEEMKDFKAALQCYDQYIIFDQHYHQKNEFFEAILKCCEQYINSEQQNHLIYMKKAQILEEKKDFKAALQCYDQYIIFDQHYHQKNDFFEALIQCYDQYINSEQQNHLLYMKKAQILQHNKNFKAALQCYDQYIIFDQHYHQKIDFFEALLKCCDQYINSEQQNHLPYIKKTQILEEKKDFKAALQCYDQFLKLAPEQFQHKDQFFSKYINCCDQYIAHNKLDHIPYLKKAQMLRKIGKILEAFNCYELCIIQSNDIYEAILNKGKILIEFKEYREAIEQFDKCIEIDPSKNEASILASSIFMQSLLQRRGPFHTGLHQRIKCHQYKQEKQQQQQQQQQEQQQCVIY